MNYKYCSNFNCFHLIHRFPFVLYLPTYVHINDLGISADSGIMTACEEGMYRKGGTREVPITEGLHFLEEVGIELRLGLVAPVLVDQLLDLQLPSDMRWLIQIQI